MKCHKSHIFCAKYKSDHKIPSYQNLESPIKTFLCRLLRTKVLEEKKILKILTYKTGGKAYTTNVMMMLYPSMKQFSFLISKTVVFSHILSGCNL